MSKSFDAKPWYEQLNDVVEKRHNQCGLKGQGFYYVPPDNLFKDYKTGIEFETRVPFNLRKDCQRASHVNGATDKMKRFYKVPQHKTACRAVRGLWDPKAVNRQNRYGRGTCWVAPEDMSCAARSEVPGLIRRENVLNKDAVVRRAKSACMVDDKCTWLDKHNDCVRKNVFEDIGAKVMDPPEDMPKDITAKESEIEQYLYDWYVNKRHGVPPLVGSLFGEGDRCNPGRNKTNANASVIKSASERLKQYPRVDVKGLNIDREEDEKMIKIIMGILGYKGVSAKIAELKRRAVHLRSYPGHQWPDNPIEDLAQAYTNFLLDEEQAAELETHDTSSNNGMRPSIPQSVLNMVMKNIARSGSSNRGLVALHSTGSGKT